jgi:hypothetical protein
MALMLLLLRSRYSDEDWASLSSSCEAMTWDEYGDYDPDQVHHERR